MSVRRGGGKWYVPLREFLTAAALAVASAVVVWPTARSVVTGVLAPDGLAVVVAAEVRGLLGAPDEVEDGGRWCYRRPLRVAEFQVLVR